MSYTLCCISEKLKSEGISFKTMTWKRYNQLVETEGLDQALALLGDKWLENVMVTRSHIEHCNENGWGYRVSSALFPVLTHPDFGYSVEDVPQHEEIMINFAEISEYNKEWKVRLSTHPDQFNVLASPNQNAVDKSIRELDHQGWVMDMLGCSLSYKNPICLHVNCTKGDPQQIADKFISNLEKCDISVQSRLVVEVEDKGIWNCDRLWDHFFQVHGIPIVFDNLHDKCNPSEKRSAWDIAETWPCRPLFHYSEAMPDQANPRKHADLPTGIPLGVRADWEIELKSKDFAIEAIEKLQEEEDLKVWQRNGKMFDFKPF
tara:strand:+ start:6107 stop:7060 length:954 start_codon:yes stop_codon:yes gene_type:complete